MAKYLGRNQIAVCMRSGAKCRAADLVRDGRNPALLVLPEWADPPHPQEQPYIPKDVEGKARWPLSPENDPVTPPILDADLLSPTSLFLHWTALETVKAPPVGYDLYRATDGGDFVLIFSGDVVYTEFGELVSEDLTYTDGTVTALHDYRYRVLAVDAVGNSVGSNTVELLHGVLDTGLLYLRQTEDDAVRQTSDDAIREVSR
jgi:hypothetical protein